MKKSVSLSLVAFILVALFATGVFADSLDFLPCLSSSNPTISSLSSEGLFIGSSSSHSYDNFIAASPSSPYVFYGIVSGASSYLYCAVKGDDTSTVYYNTSASNIATRTVAGVLPNYPDVYYVSTRQLTSLVDIPSIPTFSSAEEFISAVDSYSFVIGESLRQSIPSGYALVIQPTSGDVEIIDRSYSIVGSWSFPSLDYPDVHKTNGAIERKLSSSYLVDGFSPDRVFGQHLIPWSPTNTNPSGSSSNYSFTDGTDIILSQFGDTFVITNPIYYGYGDVNSNITRQNSVDLDVNLSIQYTSRPTIRLIALESLQDLTNGQFHYYSVFRPEVYDETGIPSVDGDSTTDVFPSAPSGGGNTGQLPVDDDASLIGIIQRFTSRVRELFNSVSSAVQTLFSSGSTFMHRLADIFSWIPEPVYVVLVSALIIVVVVGLLKIFL